MKNILPDEKKVGNIESLKYMINTRNLNKAFNSVTINHTNNVHNINNLTERSFNNTNNFNSSRTAYYYKTIQVDKNKLAIYKNNLTRSISLENKNEMYKNPVIKADLPNDDTKIRAKSNSKRKQNVHLAHQTASEEFLAKIKTRQKQEKKEMIDTKKYLRAKMQSIINRSLIFSSKHKNEMKAEQERRLLKTIAQNKTRKSFKSLFVNTKFVIKKNPDNVNTLKSPSSRFEDHFVTPDELIFKNFENKEILLIKSDPEFFRVKNSFNGIPVFKKQKLAEILNDEEAGKSLNNQRKNAFKISKKPLKNLTMKNADKIIQENDENDHQFNVILKGMKDFEKHLSDQDDLIYSRNSLLFINQLKDNRNNRASVSKERMKMYSKTTKIDKRSSRLLTSLNRGFTKKNME